MKALTTPWGATREGFMYRGYFCLVNHCYRRGEWGRYDIFAPTAKDSRDNIGDAQSIEDCKYQIDLPTTPVLAPKPVKRERKVSRFKTPRVTTPDDARAAGFVHETNDCTVRAISNARCISYAESHALCRDLFGREDKCGTFGTVYGLESQSWCKRVDMPSRRTESGRRTTGVTIDQFALANPRGHFVVLVAGHSLAICDGVVYDSWRISGLKRVKSAFEVIA